MRRNRDFIGPAGMGGMVSLWGASSLIKSVQRGTITLTGVASNTATIAAVDTTNTVVRNLGVTTTSLDSRFSEASGSITLTNSTTLTFTRGNTLDNMTTSYEVVEFNPGAIRSIQRGKTNVNGNSGAGTTATITVVNTAKTELSWLGTEGTNNPYRSDYEWVEGVLTNSTTITMFQGYTGGAQPYQWQVVEYF